MLPFLFGALGLAVGAVVGAFTTHAAGESDRQAAQYHRTVANELADKYTNLEKQYNELADKSKKQILDLTRQRALDEVEKDATMAPFSMLINALRVIRGEISPQQAGVETLKASCATMIRSVKWGRHL